MRFPWSDDAVHRFVLEAEWFAGVTAAAPELQFVDAVPLGTASDEPWLLIVDAVFGTERQRYAVPVAADPACPEMLVDGHAAGNLLEGLLGILLRDGRITTERNNEIVLDGDPHEASVRRLPFDPGWSSNAVSLVDLNGRVCVHKLFRRLDENANEATLLRLLGNRTDTVPGYVLSYHYRDVRTNKTLPLGLVYAFAEGHGLDVPLRKNLRALLSKLSEAWSMPDHDQTERLAREHACQLRPVLVEVGQRLHSFHTVLAAVLDPSLTGGSFDALGYLDRIVGAVDAMWPLLDVDMPFPAPVLERVRAALDLELGWLADLLMASVPQPLPTGPCHGDLHLGHVLVHPLGSRLVVRLIDLSTKAIEPVSSDVSRQSPWEDLVGLERAIECFAWDETTDWQAELLGLTSEQAALSSLSATAGWGGAEALAGDQIRQRLRSSEWAVGSWCDEVRNGLLAGYGVDAAGVVTHRSEGDRRATWTAHPSRRLLYLARLLHELRYNASHGRLYYTALGLRNLLDFAADGSELFHAYR